MAFDIAEWKRRAGDAFRRFDRGAAQYGPGALYAGLCATALWPVVQAIGTEGPLAGASALAGLASNVGANLIATKLWDMKGKAEDAARRDIQDWIVDQAPGNADLLATLDEILVKLDASRQAQSALNETDRAWFLDALHQELKSLGSKITINTDGGTYIAGNVNAQGDNVMGDKIVKTLIQSLTIVYGKTDPSEERGWLASYLRYVIADCSGLNLQAIDESAAHVDRDGARREPPKLADVYIDLDTTLRVPSKITSLGDFFKRARFLVGSGKSVYATEPDKPPQKDKSRPVSLLEALAHHREMVLLGKPGSGKSTFASYLALNLARAASGDEDGLKALGERWTHGVLLPVRVTLREFAQFLVESKSEGAGGDIWGFVRSSIHGKLGQHEADVIEQLAKRSGAVFIFDGLDEASSPEIRNRVVAAVEDFKRSAHPKSRFLITARPYAWGTPDPSRGVYEVADLNTVQIKSFIGRWYDALVNWSWLRRDDADERRDHLLPACERSDLLPLAENPLLLTLMATLTANGIRLPDARAELYATMVELLMNRWNQRFGKEPSLVQQLAMPGLTIASFRSVLEEIAFDAHAAHEGKAGTADIEAWQLLRAFRNLLGSFDKAQLVVNYVDERAGLLIALGERKHDGAGKSKYTFPHRTFQEFLAGCFLARQIDFNERVCALAGTNAAHWRLALAFAASRANTERGSSAADALVCSEERSIAKDAPEMSVDDGWRAMIAADQLLELGLPEVNRNEQGRKIKRRVATWLAGAMQGTLQPKERAEAGRLAAQLGDSRPGVLIVDDMPMCYVPPGEFIMGGYRYDDEKPEHLQKVKDGFWISQYPITNAQFDQFVVDKGYARKVYWAEAIDAKRWEPGRFREFGNEWREGPKQYREPFGIANHPVIGVSWYEALAFTRWLGLRLHRKCALPSEAQWEYAARGPGHAPNAITPMTRAAKALHEVTSGVLQDFASEIGQVRTSVENRRIYPWGDDADPQKMNIAETGIGSTIAAGAFPTGVSLFGCEDVSGNVWEWTMTKTTDDYKDYDKKVDNRPDGSEAARVLRGGSFNYSEYHARCAYRRSRAPARVNDDLGFRVVASPIPL